MNKKGNLIVVSGPSGVGKDTIVSNYLKLSNDYLSVSATTRSPRVGEKDKIDYFFLTEEDFIEKINNNEFLEYAKYNNNYYGTLKSQIDERLEKGINVILVIEVKGAFQIKEIVPTSKLIFIMPPSIKVLEERLKNRNLDSDEMINNRLIIAESEIKEKNKYDFVIINDNLDDAVNSLKEIIDNL